MKKLFAAVLTSFLLGAASLTLAPSATAVDYPGTVATTCKIVKAKKTKKGVKVKFNVTAGNATPAGTVLIKVKKKSVTVNKVKGNKLVKGPKKGKATVTFTPASGSVYKGCTATLKVKKK